MQKWLRALQPTEIFGLWVRGPKTDHGMCLEMCFCKCGKNLYCPPSRKSTSLLAGEALAGKWADPNSASSTLPWSRGHPAVPVPVFHLNSPCPVVLSSLLSEKMSRLSVTLSGQVLNGNGFGSNRAALRRMQETKSDLSSVMGCLIVTGHLLTAGCLFHQASSTGMSLSSLPLTALPGEQGSGQEHRRRTWHEVTWILLLPISPPCARVCCLDGAWRQLQELAVFQCCASSFPLES